MAVSIERQVTWRPVAAIVVASLLSVPLGGYVILFTGRALYIVLTFSYGSRWWPVEFGSIGLIYAVPTLIAGVWLGRWSPRWGWIPAILATLFPAGELAVATAFRYAALTPAAAVAGWLVGSYSRAHGTRWLLGTAVPLGALLVAATMMGRSDRNWLLRETARIVRYLGASYAPQHPQIMVLDLKPFAMPGDIGTSVQLDGPRQGGLPQERFSLFIHYPDFRKRVLDRAYAEREIWYPQKAPSTASAAALIARELGLPRQFLEGLHRTKVRPEPPSHGAATSAFVAGPVPGTWRQPRVEIDDYRVIVQIGGRPH